MKIYVGWLVSLLSSLNEPFQNREYTSDTKPDWIRRWWQWPYFTVSHEANKCLCPWWGERARERQLTSFLHCVEGLLAWFRLFHVFLPCSFDVELSCSPVVMWLVKSWIYLVRGYNLVIKCLTEFPNELIVLTSWCVYQLPVGLRDVIRSWGVGWIIDSLIGFDPSVYYDTMLSRDSMFDVSNQFSCQTWVTFEKRPQSWATPWSVIHLPLPGTERTGIKASDLMELGHGIFDWIIDGFSLLSTFWRSLVQFQPVLEAESRIIWMRPFGWEFRLCQDLPFYRCTWYNRSVSIPSRCSSWGIENNRRVTFGLLPDQSQIGEAWSCNRKLKRKNK